MRTAVILSTLATSALAFPSPLSPIARADTWTVAPNSTVTCAKSDKIIGFLVGPQMDTVLNDACAAMMPVCAYPDRAPKDTVCPQVMDWKLDGPKTSTQNANVEDAATGNKLSGWAVKCKFAHILWLLVGVVIDSILACISLCDPGSTSRLRDQRHVDQSRLLRVLQAHRQ